MKNEFMLNDWVNKISPSGIVVPVKVTLQELNDMEDPVERGKYVWKPILLTEDFFDANGFGWKAFPTGYSDYCLEVPNPDCDLQNSVSVAESKVVWDEFDTVYEIKIYTYSNEVVIHTKFIHEVQHALRLCGMSEVANNLKTK